MERKIFHKLAGMDEVESIIEKYIPLKPLGTEEVSLEDALGRVLAEDVFSPIDHPPFDRSEMDGYAVRSTDLEGVDDLHPRSLKIIGKIEPGEHPRIEVNPGTAVEIATGAMIPRGADSVVMVEYTKKKNNEIIIYRSTVPGENIAFTASDISMGDLILQEGTLLGPSEIGLLAGLGIRKIKVYCRPKAAVFSTGNEIVEPGEKLAPGKVYDVNGYLVTSTLQKLGIDAKFLGKLPDKYDVMKKSIQDTLKWADIVITSGGTSAGLGDLIYRVFDELGDPGIIIHGLKLKPGKPTVIAIADKKLLIGLPGFPLSCFMVLHKIVKPILAKLAGVKLPPTNRVKARIPFRIKKPLGKTWLLPVALVLTEKGYSAYPVSMKSGSISPLVLSDGYLVLPENRDLVLEGSEETVELFRDISNLPRLNIIGSNDILLYKYIAAAGLKHYTRVIATGSMGGWLAVKRGEADIAPTHLLDEESGKYNTPYLEKLELKEKAIIIRGYDRRIGIIIAKGNPKAIKSIDDFLKPGIRIVNRTKGSGTRTLLDIKLKEIASKKGLNFSKIIKKIDGYTYELKTHTAVAAAIAQGRADAGIGIEAAARLYGLDFIPISWEEYDFLIPIDRLKKKEVATFIKTLKSGILEQLIKKIPGYRIPDNIGEEKN